MKAIYESLQHVSLLMYKVLQTLLKKYEIYEKYKSKTNVRHIKAGIIVSAYREFLEQKTKYETYSRRQEYQKVEAANSPQDKVREILRKFDKYGKHFQDVNQKLKDITDGKFNKNSKGSHLTEFKNLKNVPNIYQNENIKYKPEHVKSGFARMGIKHIEAKSTVKLVFDLWNVRCKQLERTPMEGRVNIYKLKKLSEKERDKYETLYLNIKNVSLLMYMAMRELEETMKEVKSKNAYLNANNNNTMKHGEELVDKYKALLESNNNHN